MGTRYSERVTTSSSVSRSTRGRLGLGLAAFLAAVELGLAFRAGSYFPRSWLPLALAVAAVALVLVGFGPRPSFSRGQALLLGAFGLQAVWTGVSLAWAGSSTNAWQEADRTLLYVIGVGLAALAVRWAGSRGLRWLAALLLGAIGVVALATLGRLAAGSELVRLFTGGRLQYPVTYWNGLAALLMMGFWLALGLSTAPRRAWWRQALLLGTAVALAEVALLPQSRGALWSFFLVAPWLLMLSAHRFRAVANLGFVCLTVALAWPKLIGVFQPARLAARGGGAQAGAAGVVPLPTAVEQALLALLLSVLAAAAFGAVSTLVEARLSPLERRWARAIGAGLVMMALVVAGFGVVGLQRAKGDLSELARDTWSQVAADRGPGGETSSRFSDVGLNGRLEQWRIAWRAFEEQPLLGLGAQNYEFYFFQHRTTGLAVRQPHSQPMQLLSELGLPGAALWLLFVGGVLIRGTRVRFRMTRGVNRAAVTAALLAVGSWFIHSSADWLWQLGGVSWPAVLLLGGLLAVRSGETETGTREASGGRRAGGRGAAEGSGAGGSGAGGRILQGVVITTAAALLVSGSVSYLSLRYLALASAGNGTPEQALAATHTAGQLDPFTPEGAMAEAQVYREAARAAAASSGPARAWAALDNLALAAAARQRAAEREPLSWFIAYQTGLALLEYREAAIEAGALDAPGDGPLDSGSGEAPAAGAWSLLRGLARSPAAGPGEAPGSLASTQDRRETVARFRALTQRELTDLALSYLEQAEGLNPREQLVSRAVERSRGGEPSEH